MLQDTVIETCIYIKIKENKNLARYCSVDTQTHLFYFVNFLFVTFRSICV